MSSVAAAERNPRDQALAAELDRARASMRAAVGQWLIASADDDRAALERASDHVEAVAGRVAGLIRQLKLSR